MDERDDASFYAKDRFANHLDTYALATVENLIGRLIDTDRPIILDLMASWDSHIPAAIRGTIIGLGLNEAELAANDRLTECRLHDINAEPRLPFSDDSFDAVICSLSIDYVTDPVAVFRDVARVVKPQGMSLVVFSNRFFPEKVVRIWRESTEDERLDLVIDFFEQSSGFGSVEVLVSRGHPRPKHDKYPHLGIPSDPVYAVYARKGDGAAAERPQRLHRATRVRTDSCTTRSSATAIPCRPWTRIRSETGFAGMIEGTAFGSMQRHGSPSPSRALAHPQ